MEQQILDKLDEIISNRELNSGDIWVCYGKCKKVLNGTVFDNREYDEYIGHITKRLNI